MRMPDYHFSWKDTIPSLLAGCFFIAQMIYGLFYTNTQQVSSIAYFGVAVFILSGIFGMAPVIAFPKKGGVTKGKSFVHTTQVVDTGIYSIMRHPQYSSFMCWAIGASLLFQQWVVVVLGIPVIVLTYYDMTREDARNLQKFGDAYNLYMKKVPRVNFILGIIRRSMR